MPRSERRNRRGGSGRSGVASNRSAGADVLEAAATISAFSNAAEASLGHGEATFPEATSAEPGPHGISILTEIFPEHGKTEQAPPSGGVNTKDQPGSRPLIHDLMSIPTPSRTQRSVPQPPAPEPQERQSATGMLAPPAPPMLPASICRQQAPWDITPAPSAPAPMVAPSGSLTPAAPMVAPTTPPPPQGFASYRDRLRAGGQQAFQRAIDAGLVPKAMKQEWRPQVNASGPPPPPPQCASQSMATQCGVQPPLQAGVHDCSGATQPAQMAACGDSQGMWSWPVDQQQQYSVNAAGSATGPQCWTPTGAQQQMPPQMPPVMQMPQMPPQMTSPMASQMPQQAPQQPIQQMMPQNAFQAPQQMITAPGPAPVPPVPQPPQGVPPQVVQAPMMQVPMTPTASAEPQADFDRCMAIAMPGAAQHSYDKEYIAAQLKAAADTPYED